MTLQDPKKIQEELDQEDNEFYGDETASGTNPAPGSDTDTSETLKDVIGESPKHNENIGEEINKDEKDLIEEEGFDEPKDKIKLEPVESDSEEEDLTAAAGASENLVESTDDPYENLTDADFKNKK